MLDNLYENIGGKIKNWAKWIFIVEAIGSVVAAIVVPAASGDPDDFIWLSALLIVFGPLVAWVGSWLLYAFGEMVEDIHARRTKYYPLAEEAEVRKAEEKARIEAEEKAEKGQKSYICPNCRREVLRGCTMCECGQMFDWTKE